MARLMTMTILAMLVATPAGATCQAQFKFQCPMIDLKKPAPILDERGLRQRAEIYDPKVPGKPLQIRNPRTLRVLFQIEKRTGKILDSRGRREVGRIGD